MKRNLLFHIYPIRGAVWMWHAQELAKYRNVFNGRRIISVVTDSATEAEEEMRRQFAPLEAEFFFRYNQSGLAEAAYFVETLKLLQSLDPNEATFYAHAKGVTHFRESEDKLNIYRRWSEAMYALCLSRPDVVDHLLETYASIGCFRLKMERTARWLYSGTFFWLRHDVLFSRKWQEIIEERHGVEDYPGRHIRYDESFCLAGDETPWQDLYNGFVTDEKILEWKSDLDRRFPRTLPSSTF